MLPAGAAPRPRLFRRKVGAIEVTVVSDGMLNVPLSFALPETPPAEAAALFAAHGLPRRAARRRRPMSRWSKTGDELVLIDAGSGANFQPTAGKLAENMEAAGIDPARSPRSCSPMAMPITCGARSTISTTVSASRTRAT